MVAIVELRNVTKTYGESEVAVQALAGVDLRLETGAFAAAAGPSGSGKSTLLNIIGGLDQATTGDAYLDGEPLAGKTAAQLSRLRMRRVGFIFQSYNLMPVLTAYENAEYVLMLQGMPAAQRREKVMAMLERVGLAGLAHRFPRQLSGGQQQRVAIARAIVTEPALVLADEPTANVDSNTAEALLDLMLELNRERGATFLFSTHDAAVIAKARQLILLKDGQIVYDGAPADRPASDG